MPRAIVLHKKNKDLDELNSNELQFVKHLIADELWRPREAARRAGYKSPQQSANNLMRKPNIARALGREQRRRLERLELKADEVLNVLATGLFFNPLSLFTPTSSGAWALTDLDQVPDEIGRCIKKVKLKSVENVDDEGNTTTTTYFEMELLDKTKLLELAMKHCGVDGTQKIEHGGSISLGVGLSKGLGQLVMEIEETRATQIIDGTVIEDHSND